jgi:cell division protein FtsI (penicillin-binding protein 3)
MKDTVYTNNIGALTDSLSKMFGKPRAEFRKKFDEQRKRKTILHFGKGLDFDQYDRIRKFPIFKKGKIKEVLL